MRSQRIQGRGLAAMVGGVLWLGLVTLGIVHDFWASAIGVLTYENYNRLLTVPLLLFVVGWFGVRASLVHRPGRLGRASAVIVLIGLLLLLAGNVLEFWLVVFQSRYVPFRLGGPDSWPGAMIGWGLFLLGCPVVPMGLVLFGLAALRAKLLPRWNAAPLIIGLLSAFGPALAAVGSRWGTSFEQGFACFMLSLGLGWIVLGYILWSGKTATARPGSGA